MTRSTKKTVAAVAAGVITLGAGVSLATFASADPTPSPLTSSTSSPSTSPSTGPSTQPDQQRGGPGGGSPLGGGHGGDHGRGHTELAKTLATELGVTEAEVTEALEAVPEESKPTTEPSAGTEKPDPSAREAALVKGLASKLGVDETKVQAAFDKVQATRQTDHAAALKTKLDAAVKTGTLTQAEADAVTKAVEKGVVSGGGR